MDMDKIIQDLHGLMIQARELVGQYNRKIQVLNEEKALLGKDRDAHEKRVQDVNAREAAFAHVENVAKMHGEAKKLMADTLSQRDALDKSVKDHNQKVEVDRQTIANARAIQVKEQQNVERLRKNIDQEVNKRMQDLLSKMNIKAPVEADQTEAAAA